MYAFLKGFFQNENGTVRKKLDKINIKAEMELEKIAEKEKKLQKKKEMKRLLKKCLVTSLLMTFVNISNAQFTDEKLQKIDLMLRNYTILSQQNILLQQKIDILEWKNKEYLEIIEQQDSWWNRYKFEIGIGVIFTFSTTYLAIYFLSGK